MKQVIYRNKVKIGKTFDFKQLLRDIVRCSECRFNTNSLTEVGKSEVFLEVFLKPILNSYFLFYPNPQALWCINWGWGLHVRGCTVFLFLAETQHMYTYALKLNNLDSLSDKHT